MKRSLKFKSGKEWHQERRKLRELLVKGTHSKKEWEELKAKHNYMCLNCKRKEPDIKLSKDHITPLAKGGTDFIDNIQPLCRNCNSKKWANW
ncbi:HNH endonuclease [Patescibacteria group bacterium]|nr:HNH endonuclease [Patescibacteria group bacterium]